MCQLNEIENEIHFLFYCTLYDDLRATFMDRMYHICNNFFDLDDYGKMQLCFEKGVGLFALVDFLGLAWERRQCNLFKS